jgi:hypothetical protein
MPSLANGRTLRERLFSQLAIDPSGCVLWTGYRNSDGYGRIGVSGRSRAVHRVVYELLAGPIPDGLDIDHLCRVRHCANVAHLEPVTRRVNTMRGETAAAANAAKKGCPAGHEYSQDNTYFYRGRRYCRPCHRALTREANRLARARKAAAR